MMTVAWLPMAALLASVSVLAAGDGAPPEAAKDAAVEQEGPPAIDIEELERRIEVLAGEIEKLRSGEAEVELSEEDARALGLAPSAASLYRKNRGVSIAGYGEMLYENFAAENEGGRATGATSRADFLRAILYAGYRFDDKFLFNSEIEVEHADEIFVEFAYIDYLAHENLALRGGMLLMPMGLVNEFHEPTVFLGSERPETEQRIIPSTWRENGFGVHGSAGKVAYRAYVVNGLRGANFSSAGLRGGRQKGSQTLADDLAFTARLDVTPTPGVFFGGSVYTGGSGQGEVVLDGRELDVTTTIFDVHAQAQIRGFDVRGLYARASVSDAGDVNRALGLEGSSGIAETLQGGYLQLGYNVLSQVSTTDVALTAYYRFEKIDTQATVAAGFSRSGSANRTVNTVGVEVKPVDGVVFKVDYQFVSNKADSGVNQFNVNLGYSF